MKYFTVLKIDHLLKHCEKSRKCCYSQLSPVPAEPHRSVCSVPDLRTRGRWFDPRLGQYSFRGLMIVIATGFIPLSPLSCVYMDNDYMGKQPVAWKEYCAEYWLKELQESMNRCTGRSDITEKLLKTAFNTIQSINQFPYYYCVSVLLSVTATIPATAQFVVCFQIGCVHNFAVC